MAEMWLTKEELSSYLKEIGIKEEGITKILQSFEFPIQRYKFKKLLEQATWTNDIKEKVLVTWMQYCTAQERKHVWIGYKPKEEDYNLL